MLESLSLTLAAIALIAAIPAFNAAKKLRSRLRRVEATLRGHVAIAGAAARYAVERDAASRLRDANREPHLPIECRGGSGEDVLLWALFDGKLDGGFIEVGAYDGRRYSISHVFEAVGWTGLLAEPLPSMAKLCAAYRTRSKVVQAALVSPEQVGILTLEIVADQGETEGTMSRVVREGADRVVEVEAMTADAALEDITTPIDFAVIDVEGAETHLLRGLDLDTHPIGVLVVEHTDVEGTEGDRAEKIRVLLESRDYERVASINRNGWFIRNDRTDLKERFASLMFT
ncbi:MAG: FkbM family methyltransferase [Planctomycetota bacterium]